MKRLLKWVSPALPALALLIGVSAGTASAPSGHATPVRPRTVVSVKAPIRAFAQDQETIAWVGSRYWVNVRSLRVRASAAVGYVGPARNGARWSPALTLAGSRALWNTFPSGGNSLRANSRLPLRGTRTQRQSTSSSTVRPPMAARSSAVSPVMARRSCTGEPSRGATIRAATTASGSMRSVESSW